MKVYHDKEGIGSNKNVDDCIIIIGVLCRCIIESRGVIVGNVE